LEEDLLEEPLQELDVDAVVLGVVAFVVGVVAVRADVAVAGFGRAGRAGTGTAGRTVAGGPEVSIPIVWAPVSQVALLSWSKPL
jgi:hypothetical protein